MLARLGLGLALVLALFLGAVWLLGSGTLGDRWEDGEPESARARRRDREVARAPRSAAPRARSASRSRSRSCSATCTSTPRSRSTRSWRACRWRAATARTRSRDACDFARHCSALDFWSINDHDLDAHAAEVAGDDRVDPRSATRCRRTAANPDTVAYLGWEWTQVGTTPDNHYGHKNVILRDLEDDDDPDAPDHGARCRASTTRAAAAARRRCCSACSRSSRYSRAAARLRALHARDVRRARVPDGRAGARAARRLPRVRGDARRAVREARRVGRRLDGDPARHHLGLLHAARLGWDKQLAGSSTTRPAEADRGVLGPRQLRGVPRLARGRDRRRRRQELPRAAPTTTCPRAGAPARSSRRAAPRRARTRTSARSARRRAPELRRRATPRGYPTVPGATVADWQDSGQCRDCFQPAFNYRPRSSVQYIMSLGDFADPARPAALPLRLHRRRATTTPRGPAPATRRSRAPSAPRRASTTAAMRTIGLVRGRGAGARAGVRSLRPDGLRRPVLPPARRPSAQASFFLTGGLSRCTRKGRDRDAIWDALQRSEVYGTSGPRILLWFDLLNPPGSTGKSADGQRGRDDHRARSSRCARSARSSRSPAARPTPTTRSTPERVERLCRGECYHPSDQRRPITRIEVVRIRPQAPAGEPVDALIEDPWRVLPCEPDPTGCTPTFTDPDFAEDGRDALYYVRAIEAPSPAVDADPLALRDATRRATARR